MLIQIVLCSYLLLTVIDLILIGVAVDQWVWIGIALLNLCLFVFTLCYYSSFFQHVAAQEGKRVVFTPIVFLFFSLAVGLLLGRLLDHTWLTLGYILLSMIAGLILFSLTSSVFDVFWFKATRIQYLVWGRIFVLGVVRSIYSLGIGKNISSVTPSTEIKSLSTWEISNSTGLVLSGEENTSGDTSYNWEKEESIKLPTWVVLEASDAADKDIPEANIPLTYRVLLPYLDNAIGFTTTSAKPTFDFVSSTDSIYGSFARAQGMNMIWTNINPVRQVRCGNLMVILGMTQWRKVSSDLPVIDAYRQAAVDREMTGGCSDAQQIATQADIPQL